MRVCDHCEKEFEGRGRFCSRGCMPSKHRVIDIPCPQCGKPRKLAPSQARKNVRCRDCASSANTGANSATWRGGHRFWSPGRFGKDKDGLSWKAQRKLAWERDGYTCQHCHVKGRRNPDVHHINPWMNSHSHALSNLICLCQSCHLKEEAKVQETWGGTTFHPKVCVRCGKRCQAEKCTVCKNAERHERYEARRLLRPARVSKQSPESIALTALKESLLPLVQQLHAEGHSLAQIAAKLPIKLHRQTMYNWLKWGSIHRPRKNIGR